MAMRVAIAKKQGPFNAEAATPADDESDPLVGPSDLADKTKEPVPIDVNISLSGGGVRSASFSLGALQALEEQEGLVYGDKPARYLTCVSGGSYIASTLVLSTDRDEFPLARNGPVEEFLRLHCRYLYDQPGRIWGVVGSALARLFANLLLIIATIFAVGALLGLIYQEGHAWLDSVKVALLWVVAVVALVGVVAGCARVMRNWDRPEDDDPRRWDTFFMWLSWGGLGVAALVGLLLVLVPAWLGNALDASITAGGDVGTVHDTGVGGRWWEITTWGGSGAWATVVSFVAILLGASTSKGTPAREGANSAIADRVRSTLWKWRAPVANFLALVAGPILLASIAGASLAVGYTNDALNWAGVGWVIAVVVVIVAWFQTDVVNWSLHPPYRDRLFSCFGGTLGQDGTVESVRQTKLSAVGPSRNHRVPKIKVCAALNVSTRAVTPAGSHVLPWVFSPDFIGVPTSVPGRKKTAVQQVTEDGPRDGDGNLTDVRWKTGAIERAVQSSTDITLRLALQSASAMAAAAVSPSMGRMTRAPLRMLMAMFNVRLGVWVPNPMNKKQQRAVTRILTAADGTPGHRDAKWRSWSGPLYLFLELLGQNSIYRRWVYVTDGGHYENLGLVEALRDDHVRAVVCIDAAGDPPGGTTTLAQALALARSELGFEVVEGDLDTFRTLEGSSKGNFRCHATHGVFTLQKHERRVQVIAIRLGLVNETASDLRDYARQHPTFPYDSTANQVYKADRFDAYRALGWDSARRALNDPLVQSALEQARTSQIVESSKQSRVRYRQLSRIRVGQA